MKNRKQLLETIIQRNLSGPRVNHSGLRPDYFHLPRYFRHPGDSGDWPGRLLVWEKMGLYGCRAVLRHFALYPDQRLRHSRRHCHRRSIGFMTAVYLAKLANPKVKSVVQGAVSLLAGIPSVVYGLVGMMTLVPAIRILFHVPDGASLLAAIIVLAVMILPSIINVSMTALEAVRRSMKTLRWPWGLRRWKPIFGYRFRLLRAELRRQWYWGLAGRSARRWPS